MKTRNRRVRPCRVTIAALIAMVLGPLSAQALDLDDNPPGPRGGPGTNWENPPGVRGGPGASPDRYLYRGRTVYDTTGYRISGGDWRTRRDRWLGLGAPARRYGQVGDPGFGRHARFHGPGRHRAAGFDRAPFHAPVPYGAPRRGR